QLFSFVLIPSSELSKLENLQQYSYFPAVSKTHVNFAWMPSQTFHLSSFQTTELYLVLWPDYSSSTDTIAINKFAIGYQGPGAACFASCGPGGLCTSDRNN